MAGDDIMTCWADTPKQDLPFMMPESYRIDSNGYVDLKRPLDTGVLFLYLCAYVPKDRHLLVGIHESASL